MNQSLLENDAAQPSASLLGEIVTWDIPGLDVEAQDVRDGLSIAGLDPNLAKDLRAVTAFRRAIKEYQADRTIDKVSREGDVITFQFTGKTIQGDKLKFSYECQVTLNAETGVIDCAEDPEIERHARQMFAHCMMRRTTSDITRMVQTLFQQHADLYSINPKKGVAYFVPQAHAHFSSKIAAFLGHLGGRLLRFPVPTGTDAGNQSVQAAVNEGLTEALAELEEIANNWDEKTRDSTTAKTVKKWQEARHKIESYGEYLGVTQERLLERAEEIKQLLAKKIVGVADMKDTAAAKKKGERLETETADPGLLPNTMAHPDDRPPCEDYEPKEDEQRPLGIPQHLLPEPETFEKSEFVSGSGNGPELGSDVLPQEPESLEDEQRREQREYQESPEGQEAAALPDPRNPTVDDLR